MLRNLILDWSGTLADDLGPVAGAANLIFHRLGQAELLLEEFRESFRCRSVRSTTICCQACSE